MELHQKDENYAFPRLYLCASKFALCLRKSRCAVTRIRKPCVRLKHLGPQQQGPWSRTPNDQQRKTSRSMGIPLLPQLSLHYGTRKETCRTGRDRVVTRSKELSGEPSRESGRSADECEYCGCTSMLYMDILTGSTGRAKCSHRVELPRSHTASV
jgi:hypothetical protein